jgi:hypothetical protein
VCLYVYPPIVARQRIGTNVTTATNTHETIEELFDGSFSVWSVPYQGEVDDLVLPRISCLMMPVASDDRIISE